MVVGISSNKQYTFNHQRWACIPELHGASPQKNLIPHTCSMSWTDLPETTRGETSAGCCCSESYAAIGGGRQTRGMIDGPIAATASLAVSRTIGL